MASLSETQVLFALLAIAVILVIGRGTAHVARLLGQPEVLGELVGGFLIGPSVFGALFPGLSRGLFGNSGVGLSLSLLSWLGAILVLLIAGMEVDLPILLQTWRPGSLAAAGAVIPSLIAGTLFGWLILGRLPPGGVFLGIVLSVSAVSVAAKILIERDALRRSYAQVILAAGVASEVLVWLFVSVASSLHGGSPLIAGLRSLVLAVAFIAVMMTLGRRFAFWAMRRVADLTPIVYGQLTFILVFALVAAATTQALGLHALLGAFVVGVLLSSAPRTTVDLRRSTQTLTVSFFAPIFFVLAGMRVDIFKLGGIWTISTVVLLLVTASIVKIGFGSLGALLGKLPPWEALLVGVGLNLKGGTDVVVAIVGAELGLLSGRVYTLYAVVAILTVLLSPPLMTLLQHRAPPRDDEMARLNREEARRRAYLPGIERILMPMVTELLPARAMNLVHLLVQAKREEGEILDITELQVAGDSDSPEVIQAGEQMMQTREVSGDEVTEKRVKPDGALTRILTASRDHGLIVLGAARPRRDVELSLGELQDQIIDQAVTDVLVLVDDGSGLPEHIARILVPVNGLEYSMKAADVGAYLARASGAELVMFNVMHARPDSPVGVATDHRPHLEGGYRILRELRSRIERLDVTLEERVEVNNDPGGAIVAELRRQKYDLVVMGAVDRGGDNRLYLGSPIQTVLAATHTPAVLLITHEPAGQAVAA